MIHKLLSNLLQNEPKQRMNAKEALEFIDTYKNQSFIECLTTNTDWLINIMSYKYEDACNAKVIGEFIVYTNRLLGNW